MTSLNRTLESLPDPGELDRSFAEEVPSALAEGFGLEDESALPSGAPVSREFEEIQDDGFLASMLSRDASSAPSERPIRTGKAARLPGAGDEIGGLRLVRELGRGAFARVFLAHELSLAARPVAAKISKARRDESSTLAQLQHSHIVPIYSAHVDPATGLHILVMPYYGGTTLDRILAKAGPNAEQNPTGRGLLTALDHLSLAHDGNRRSPEADVSQDLASHASRSVGMNQSQSRELELVSLRRRILGRALPGMARKHIVQKENAAQPARQILEKSSYIEAITWIAARLADGLAHAHQRGIVHRDIKPSNVLIASDGQPMLLDFNLARDIKTNEASTVAYVGGTLPYMAPEHLDAFNNKNPTPASAVDHRSDIYSLGVLLFEMLTNDRPFVVEKPEGPMAAALERMAAQRRLSAPSPRQLNDAVPWSLDAIVRRCLAPDPADRYQDAASLAEDLQCELDSLPLRHTREPSWRERTRKWMRRHPRLSSGASIASIGAVLILALVYLILAIGGRLVAYDAERRWIKFQEGLIRAQLLIHTGTEPGENLDEGQRVCEQTLGLFGILSSDHWMHGSRVRYLDSKSRHRLPEDAAELVILLARTRAELAKNAHTAREQAESVADAVRLLNRAEQFSHHPPRALFEDRSNYRLLLGDTAGAAADQEKAKATEARTARDYYLKGTALAIHRKYDAAVTELKNAIALEPKHFWARFQLAICYYQLGQFYDAANAYSVCEALWLECAWTNLNRGLAYSRLDLLDDAIHDYTQAIHKDPRLADAYMNRGLAYLKQKRYEQSILDLDRALAIGNRTTGPALSARATAYAGLGQYDRAKRDYTSALAANPGDPSIRFSRGFALARHEPDQALEDFDAILRQDPKSARAHYGRAYVLGDVPGRLDDAIAAARESLRCDDRHIGARCTLAVLLARGGLREEASEQIAAALEQSTAPVVQYTAACVFALASPAEPAYADQAIDRLETALKSGYGLAVFHTDPDLAPLHDLPRFQTIQQRYEQ